MVGGHKSQEGEMRFKIKKGKYLYVVDKEKETYIGTPEAVLKLKEKKEE